MKHTRRASLALVLLLIAGLFGGCSPDDPFVPTKGVTPVAGKGAWLRVVHAAALLPEARVRLDTTYLFGGATQGYLAFSDQVNAAKYYPVDSAASTITFLAAGGATLASAPVDFAPNGYYTAYLHGSPGNLRVLVTADTVTPPDRNAEFPAKIRVVHLSPDSPRLDMHFDSASSTPIVSNLEYGTASDYVFSRSYEPGGRQSALWILESGTDRAIYELPAGYVFVLPGYTFTMVLTGYSTPAGDEPYVQFSAFNESARGADSLYGAPPFSVRLSNIRFVNLVPSPEVDTGSLDLTFYDPSPEFVGNDNYRRTLSTNASERLDNVWTLGKPGQSLSKRAYHPISYNVDKELTYRIEYHQAYRIGVAPLPGRNPYDYRPQDVFAPPNTFFYGANRRYTIVAYGPYVPPVVPPPGHSTVLVDNTLAPPSGMAQVRLFHGAFGAPYETARLAVRVKGSVTSTEPVAYGASVAGTNSIAVPAGAVTLEVVDATGTVMLEQTLTDWPLGAGRSYTLFLNRGYKGDSILLIPLAEDLNN